LSSGNPAPTRNEDESEKKLDAIFFLRSTLEKQDFGENPHLNSFRETIMYENARVQVGRAAKSLESFAKKNLTLNNIRRNGSKPGLLDVCRL
jgi:hypothetical protein